MRPARLANKWSAAVLLVPVGLGCLQWLAQSTGVFGEFTGLVLSTEANVVVLGITVLILSAVLKRAEGLRSSAEQRLRESERRFGELADAMPQIVWTALPTGEPDYHNRGWFEYCGCEHTSPDGMRSATHPDDLAESERLWRDAVETGKTYSCEVRLRDRAGKYRWHLKRALPFLGSGGEIVRWIGTCTEIEEYKNVQQALRELNRNLESRVDERTGEVVKATAELAKTSVYLAGILDAATQAAIVFVDSERIIRIFNKGAQRMLGYDASEIVGIRTSDVLLDSVEVAERLAEKERVTGKPATRADLFVVPALRGTFGFEEWNYVRKDGTKTPVALSMSAVRDAQGEVVGFLSIAIDITQQKELERELRRNNRQLAEQTRRADTASRAKDQFLAAMSHEIRTPLNGIIGIADLLAESPLDDEQRHYVEISRRAGAALMTLINDILDFSKIEAGLIELEHIEFDLEDTIEEALDLTAPKARARKLNLVQRIAPGLVRRRMGDPERLRQILTNLLGNATKFTDHGEVVLNVSPAGEPGGGSVEFAVSDTGIGIPADKIEAIFEDFRQADSSTTRRYGGTGLGLGISRRLVERMGGRLTVESEPGRGSTFRFILAIEMPARENEPSADSGSELADVKALLLDDHATNRAILAELLSSWGASVREFRHPGAALNSLGAEMLTGEPYDLILVDCHEEESQAVEAIRLMRSYAPGTPVVMLTSSADTNAAARRLECGLASHTVKPVRRRHLLRMLAQALGREEPADSGLGRNGEPEPAVAQPRALRILIAEDLPDNQTLMRAYLKGGDHVLTFAGDGGAAVKAFCAGRFDLVLMDMRMPVMDGLTAAGKIREFERIEGRAETPIIALSANAAAADIKASADAGCQFHLAKPVTRSRLLAAIRDHVAIPADPVPAEEEEEARLIAEIQMLLPSYLHDREEDVAAISQLLQSGDFDALRTLGHNMKGSGASYGLPEVSSIGQGLENAAVSRQAESVWQFARDLRSLTERMQRESGVMQDS